MQTVDASSTMLKVGDVQTAKFQEGDLVQVVNEGLILSGTVASVRLDGLLVSYTPKNGVRAPQQGDLVVKFGRARPATAPKAPKAPKAKAGPEA